MVYGRLVGKSINEHLHPYEDYTVWVSDEKITIEGKIKKRE